MTDTAVDCIDMGSGVAKIVMQDRIHKNTFSEEIIRGLFEAFEKVETEKFKVAILTGYDNYFSSGGTQEGLLTISEGKAKFTLNNMYSLTLNCRIPVISAMQGHGIGGGFVLGLFADFVVLSRESVYTTNFMKYGFTPGMGATLILPKKLGISLAEEMLLSAKTYRGEDLQKRGVPFPVISRKEIMEYSMELAFSVAEKPRNSLITLKDHLVSGLRKRLPMIIEEELLMHEKTFHNPEVKERIEKLFGN
jgi:polyketide biosynthesis enoyl-CoA hydratase PksI